MMADTQSEYSLVGPADDGSISNVLASLNAKAGRQRLQALIAEWLRMENVVVLCGAGTSVSCGGKTMADLEKQVLATARARSSLPPSISAILDARQAPPSGGVAQIGFEEWLSYIVNATFLGGAASSPFAGMQWRSRPAPKQRDLEDFVATLSKSIFAECALTLPDAASASATANIIAPQIAFLSKLVARDSNLGRAHLFTLNYDTLFEQALELLGIQYFDGFTGRANARFDPSIYGLDVYYPGEVAEGRVRRFDKFLHLYKLHGSIHWRVLQAELRAGHEDLARFAEYQKLDPSGKARLLDSLTDGVKNVGILPTANKFAQTLSMPYAHLFRSFQIRLSAPQTFLLILGYGFGDDHVNRIIETALMNPSLVMLVVEPHANSPIIERVRRYKELGRRAFVLTATSTVFAARPFQAATFDDFARSIMPDVQWLEDFLRLRRYEKQIQASEDRRPGGDDNDSSVSR